MRLQLVLREDWCWRPAALWWRFSVPHDVPSLCRPRGDRAPIAVGTSIAGCPPAQIPAGVIHAPGSHLGWLTPNPTDNLAYTVEALGHVSSRAGPRPWLALPSFPQASPLAPSTPPPVAT